MNAADWFRKTLKGRVQRALATSPRLRAMSRAAQRLLNDGPKATPPPNPSPKRRDE